MRIERDWNNKCVECGRYICLVDHYPVTEESLAKTFVSKGPTPDLFDLIDSLPTPDHPMDTIIVRVDP